MTQKAKLETLLAKVEAGELGKDQHTLLWVQTIHKGLHVKTLDMLYKAYHGSLDAALSLHHAVLPEYFWNIGGTGEVIVEAISAWPHCPIKGSDDNPARAWLIAIIKALISECDQ